MADYYSVLGVRPTATLAEIKISFRRLALKYHPDANKSDKVAESKFKALANAYEVLSDPDKRRKYDAELTQQRRPGYQSASTTHTTHSTYAAPQRSFWERYQRQVIVAIILVLIRLFGQTREARSQTDIHVNQGYMDSVAAAKAVQTDSEMYTAKMIRNKQDAESGDAAAQYRLGLMYEKGEAVMPNTTLALYWYRLAAAQGYPEAKQKISELSTKGYR